MRISGWCSGPNGASDNFHDVCQERIDRGLIELCECPGHLTAQGVSALRDGRIETSKRPLGGASTPLIQGALPTNKESTSA